MRFLPQSASHLCVGVQALGLLLIAPFIATADVLQPETDSAGVHSAGVTRDPSDAARAIVDFPLPAGDESYAISIAGLPLPVKKQSCRPQDLSNVVVNGQSLQDFAAGPVLHDENVYDSVRGTLSVIGKQDQKNHSLTLVIDAICEDTPSNLCNALNAQYCPQVFGISIVEIDKVRWTGKKFNISSHFSDGKGVSIVVQESSRSDSGWDATKDGPDAPSDSILGGSDVVELADNFIEQEIHRLRALQDELEAVKKSLKQQTILVDKLTKDKHHDAKKEIEDCENISCVLGTIYRKGKECIHLAYLRYKPSGFGPSIPDDCYEMSSVPGSIRSKVLTNGSKGCSGRYQTHHRKPIPHSEENTPLLHELNHGEKYSFSDAPTSDSYVTGASPATRKIHGVLVVVASLLCLTCLTAALHRRCCNPRARADRAARQEERRTRRQYRCAARKRAWRDWWERQQCRLGQCGRRSSRRIHDYEEKRALILQQEAVLESAMQDEISTLEATAADGVVNDVLTMAEEGRMSHPPQTMGSRPSARSGGSETLPVYRSRSNSGRPPSYNEFDESVGSIVADGFTNYIPSGVGNDEVRSVRSFASAESSVVDLSPRHSSETLRTERSAL